MQAEKRAKTPFLTKRVRNRYLFYAVIPVVFYFVFFCLLTWPWISHFNTRFFADTGDGFQNIWDMWWVNYSVTHLHQLPWHTTYLHYPYGTTLIGQTLNPFNGFVAILLLKFLTLVQSFNAMVVFSFVFGGVSAFWLCHYFSRKYVASLIGGFIFTFSSYHFAHAIGHMQLVSLEWIPLFMLLWWRLLVKPRYRTAIGAAIVLFLVLLCDYYYFLYCVLAGGLIVLYLWRSKQLAPIKLKRNHRPIAAFAAIALLLTAPLPLALLRENSRDPLMGAHDARLFSTDLFSMVIDGGFWHFASLTTVYWRHVKAYVAESSVYFGLSVICLLIIALFKRSKINRYISFWLVLGITFVILSMGPRLMVLGYSINHAPLPYALVTKIFPDLNLSGDPDRFIVMGFLAAAVISSMVLAKLNLSRRKGKALMVLFFVVLCFEVWPGTYPVNVASAYPNYVNVLKKLPSGAVVDNAAISASWALYDQAIDQKPEVFGYISRIPTSVYNQDSQLTAVILRNQLPLLCRQYKIRYFTTPTSRPLVTNFPIIYRGSQNLIYDLKDSPNC